MEQPIKRRLFSQNDKNCKHPWERADFVNCVMSIESDDQSFGQLIHVLLNPRKQNHVDRLEIHLGRLNETDIQTTANALRKCTQTHFSEIAISGNPADAQADLSMLLLICFEKAVRLSFQRFEDELPSSAFSLISKKTDPMYLDILEFGKIEAKLILPEILKSLSTCTRLKVSPIKVDFRSKSVLEERRKYDSKVSRLLEHCQVFNHVHFEMDVNQLNDIEGILEQIQRNSLITCLDLSGAIMTDMSQMICDNFFETCGWMREINLDINLGKSVVLLLDSISRNQCLKQCTVNAKMSRVSEYKCQDLLNSISRCTNLKILHLKCALDMVQDLEPFSSSNINSLTIHSIFGHWDEHDQIFAFPIQLRNLQNLKKLQILFEHPKHPLNDSLSTLIEDLKTNCSLEFLEIQNDLHGEMLLHLFDFLKFNQTLSRLIIRVHVSKGLDDLHEALSSYLEANTGVLELLEIESERSMRRASIPFPKALLNNFATNKHLRSCDFGLINYKIDQKMAINTLNINQSLVKIFTQVLSRAEFIHRNREHYLSEIRISTLFKFRSTCDEVNLFREIFSFASCLEYTDPQLFG
jgi:hypothetical protein